MRWWVHKLWQDRNGFLRTQGPKDDNGIESLIASKGERVAAIAWALYIYEEPAKYNLYGADEKKITKFPLASFLKLQDSYVVEALARLSQQHETNTGLDPADAGTIYQEDGLHINAFELVDAAMNSVPPAPLQRKW